MNRVNKFLHRLMIVPLLVLIAFVVEVVIWSVDRHPPFEVLATAPAMVAPGEIVDLVADVRRDTDRGCSARFTRHIYDGASSRHDLEGVQIINAEGIRDIERRTPGQLWVSVRVPSKATPGQASLVTNLDYTCNPLHGLWPIHVITEIPFTITEPKHDLR